MDHLKIFIAFLLLTICGGSAFSQNYFQQDLKYTIHVTLDDKKHKLTGFEEIDYKNNSNTVLSELYFHLYPNAYKYTTTALAQELFNNGKANMMEAGPQDFGYIDSLDFKINGAKTEWDLLTDTIDICRIKLAMPLNPGESIVISTPFKIKLPSYLLSRLGHNEQAYYITQWYPKPAVYDKNGWNYFSYLDKGEYYSEFGSFDVTITLPENYVVGATGELVDGANELSWLENKSKETMALSEFPKDLDFPSSSSTLKTLHYKQDNIHDFAWFADKRWHVLKGEVELPQSKKKVTTWSFFTNAEAELWRKAPEYISRTLRYMSDWVGEYPYSSCTAVDITDASGDGMEYPMITTIGSYGDPFELDITIVHEVQHNWFYGILGSNERKHPWMDEGITNFYETRYVYTEYANDSAKQLETIYSYRKFRNILNLKKFNHKELQYDFYLAIARRHTDVSQDQFAQNFSRSNYKGDVYYKTSMCFDYLKTYLGDELFDRCMHRYFTNWRFKHPDPDDIKREFEIESGHNLDWFFDDLMRSNKTIDYSICSIKKKGDKAELTLSNKGEIENPLWISTFRDGKEISIEKLEGFSGKKNIDVGYKKGDIYKIDGKREIPEIDRKNNTIRSEGLFKKTEKINLKFLSNIENPDRTQFFYIPVVGFNMYNSVMGGFVFHNVSFHEKPFEFAVMPMYASRTKDLSGGADFRYHFYIKNSFIKNITLQETIGHYAYGNDDYTNETSGVSYSNILKYSKFDTRLILTLTKPHPQKNISKEIELRNVFVNRDIAESDLIQGPGFIYTKKPKKVTYNYFTAEYRRINANVFDASSQRFAVTFDVDHIKAVTELKQFFCFGPKNKGINVRFFGGYVNIAKEVKPDADYRFNLSGTVGSRDYLYDDIFLGRTETSGLLAQQFIRNDAGFTTSSFFYRKAHHWMTGLNMSTTLPGLIPFRLYANLGTFNDANKSGIVESGTVSWEIGIELPVMKDVLTIYLPFSYSKDIKYVIDQKQLKTADLIRFELHLQKLNPLNYIRTTLR